MVFNHEHYERSDIITVSNNPKSKNNNERELHGHQ